MKTRSAPPQASPRERLRREGYREGTIYVHPESEGGTFTMIHGLLRENQSGSFSVVEFEGEVEISETYPPREVLKVVWGPPPGPFSQGDGWWREWAQSRLERFPPPVELDVRKEVSAALLALTERSGRTLEQLFPGQEETMRLWVEGGAELQEQNCCPSCRNWFADTMNPNRSRWCNTCQKWFPESPHPLDPLDRELWNEIMRRYESWRNSLGPAILADVTAEYQAAGGQFAAPPGDPA